MTCDHKGPVKFVGVTVVSIRTLEGDDAVSFVSQSAEGYYPRGNAPLAEDSGPGNGFLSEVVQAWEAEARKAEELGVRVVTARTGVVLSRAFAIGDPGHEQSRPRDDHRRERRQAIAVERIRDDPMAVG